MRRENAPKETEFEKAKTDVSVRAPPRTNDDIEPNFSQKQKVAAAKVAHENKERQQPANLSFPVWQQPTTIHRNHTGGPRVHGKKKESQTALGFPESKAVS